MPLGIIPVNALSERLSSVREGAESSGMAPESSFPARESRRSSGKEREEGRAPLREFPERSSCWRYWMRKRSPDMEPRSWEFLRTTDTTRGVELSAVMPAQETPFQLQGE